MCISRGIETLEDVTLKEIQNKTKYPIIRFDNINIVKVEANNHAEIFHPFVGYKKIAKNESSLKKIMWNLQQTNVEIDIDESTIMGVERNSALMILGYLYKVKFIDFKETTQNHLSIWLTDEGENIKLSN